MRNETIPIAATANRASRLDLRALACEYPYKQRLSFDRSPTFDIASKKLQRAGCLSKAQLHAIAKWKSPRSARRVDANQPADVKKFTRIAFTLARDRKMPRSVPIAILTALRGVRVPTASVILTIWDPKRFGIIDVNAWSTLVGKKRKGAFTAGEYDLYSEILRRLSAHTKLTPREIDMALWTHWNKKAKARRARKKARQ